jgi:hypothetical protein
MNSSAAETLAARPSVLDSDGYLLSLSLKVPPWENLHELSPRELQITGLVTTDAATDVVPDGRVTDSAVGSLTLGPAQDRLVGSADDEMIPPAPKSTKTAEAAVSTGEVMAVVPARK